MGVDCTVRTNDDVADRMDDVADRTMMWQTVGIWHVLLAVNGNATRGPITGRHVSLVYLLKPLHSAGVDSVTSGQGKALGKAAQLACPCMFLVMYMRINIFNIVIMCIWAWGGPGLSPDP
jgi:hypothetical protein